MVERAAGTRAGGLKGMNLTGDYAAANHEETASHEQAKGIVSWLLDYAK